VTPHNTAAPRPTLSRAPAASVGQVAPTDVHCETVQLEVITTNRTGVAGDLCAAFDRARSVARFPDPNALAAGDFAVHITLSTLIKHADGMECALSLMVESQAVHVGTVSDRIIGAIDSRACIDGLLVHMIGTRVTPLMQQQLAKLAASNQANPNPPTP
jgi:hypothetical protein